MTQIEEETLLSKLRINAEHILLNNYKIKNDTNILIIYDKETKLSQLLKKGFEDAATHLKNNFQSLEFYSKSQEDILREVDQYKEGDIVVLIQTSSFRVSNYRWRNELCNKGFKVVEFGQLKHMDLEHEAFIESLSDDYEHYEKISTKLTSMIHSSHEIKIISSDNSEVVFSGPMDKCIRNIGSLWEQTNWTTRYPIGELITESLDLETLNGELLVYAYPNTELITSYVKPFKCKIEKGYLIAHEGPEEFNEIIEMIKTENEKGLVFVRELGIGLNRHIKKDTRLSDPLAYERVEGLHFSLGMKHGMYQKKLWKTWGKNFYQKYHIDIYIDIKEMYIDNVLCYTQEKGYF